MKDLERELAEDGKVGAVVVVGGGFAGKLHAAAWRKLNYSVSIIDIDPDVCDDCSCGDDSSCKGINDCLSSLIDFVHIVDFCDAPKSRLQYAERFKDKLKGKIVYFEKPVCRPCDVQRYIDLTKELDIVPIHNYLFMLPPWLTKEKQLEVSILRKGPHKGWYIDLDLTGSGIIGDHGYHWLYVADEMGADISQMKGWVDGVPDMTCRVESLDEKFKMYATWRSPMRMTTLNGKPDEFRTSGRMADSFMKLFDSTLKYESERRRLVDQSIRVMKCIEKVYGISGLPTSRDGEE
jgi:hypothetical protein